MNSLRCRCGHDGYAHGLPGAAVIGDTACDDCQCPRWRPEPDVLLGVPGR